MSYRTLKRMIGETNFELKCLIMFGVGLTVLATATYLLYSWQTTDLVEKSNLRTSRQLVTATLFELHWKYTEGDTPVAPMIDEFAKTVRSKDLPDYQWNTYHSDPTSADTLNRPEDGPGYEAIEELRHKVALGVTEIVKKIPDRDEYRYYAAQLASKNCLDCHWHNQRKSQQGTIQKINEGDMIGVVEIILPLTQTEAAKHRGIAFVITAEFIKVVLALVGIYLIVRYVITKPVLYLKKVSDAIAHGNLDMRADIRTGDEFEELSHAFNRMLRHLVTIQEELREVNSDLDGKVDELAQVNLQLYEMNNLKNEFLATMSHELRTPLNSILGFSEVLSNSENLNDKQDRYVANIQTSGKNLMALINDVLDLAKIESGKVEVHAVEFSISDLVERQAGTMIPLAEKKNIELTWDVEDSIPILVQDAGKIQQIVNNLLSNAIKFTPEGGRVQIHAALFDPNTLDLWVDDTGVGIPLEDQESIFEKFRQGKTLPGQKGALTREFEGTGLGLSIVKELARILQGEILLDSEFGKGSTFTLRIPVCLEEEPPDLDDNLTSQFVGINRLKPEDIGIAGLGTDSPIEEAKPTGI